MDNHGVVHFEIYADDPDKPAEFYKGMWRWEIQSAPGMAWCASVSDPQGNSFGLWQTDPNVR